MYIQYKNAKVNILEIHHFEKKKRKCNTYTEYES